MQIRRLTEADRDAADAFLLAHCDSSMFLRANLRRAGLHYTGKPFTGVYVAAFEGAAITGVIAHSWNGMLLVQAPVHAEALAHAVVAASGREVLRLSGPRTQVAQVCAALGLGSEAALNEASEDLYSLELSELHIPESVAGLACRAARPEDRGTLVRWRTAYSIEAMGMQDEEATRTEAAIFLDAQLGSGDAWVAALGAELCSLSAFNASLPEIVQLGGIYTPPELRGRGYARHAIAAQLRAANARGARRSVLFTKNPSAVRCYEALGYRRTGDFALLFL